MAIEVDQGSSSFAVVICLLSIYGVIFTIATSSHSLYTHLFKLSLESIYHLWNDSGNNSSSFAKFEKEHYHSFRSNFI